MVDIFLIPCKATLLGTSIIVQTKLSLKGPRAHRGALAVPLCFAHQGVAPYICCSCVACITFITLLHYIAPLGASDMKSKPMIRNSNRILVPQQNTHKQNKLANQVHIAF